MAMKSEQGNFPWMYDTISKVQLSNYRFNLCVTFTKFEQGIFPLFINFTQLSLEFTTNKI